MTERGHRDLQRSSDALSIGPSHLRWDGDALLIDVQEISAPFPVPIRGTVRISPQLESAAPVRLDAAGRHRWFPIAPRARVEARFDRPSSRWTGTGYVDANAGSAPLEEAFSSWMWSRAALGRRGAAVLYDVVRRDQDRLAVAMAFDERGARSIEVPPQRELARTKWRLPRSTRSEGSASVKYTLEDTPFYARSIVCSELCGERVESVHESLSLDRFSSSWVKLLLPFRMPRNAR